jgi:malonyl-ACP decarboxylase
VSKNRDSVVITGLGVVSAIGAGIEEFAGGLRQGACGIRRFDGPPSVTAALMPEFSSANFLKSLPNCPEDVKQRGMRVLRQAPGAAQMTAAAAVEAWLSAGWHNRPGDTDRLGLIVGGNNVSHRYLAAAWSRFRESPDFLSPRYAFLSLDTNLIGTVSEILGIRGCGLTTGGASASGSVALWNAKHLLEAGAADALLVCGAPSELSALEWQAFRNLGASAPPQPETPAEALYRPFDITSQGFVPGEGSACVMVETARTAIDRGARIWATLAGASLVLEGSHLPQASTQGEVRAMQLALEAAQIPPDKIDYVNTHGSGSSQGDRCECDALREVFGAARPWVNSTKSLTGHCLTAAGLIELVACAIQMDQGFVHANRNLKQPIDSYIRFAGGSCMDTPVRTLLANSFGFGGINSSIVLRRPKIAAKAKERLFSANRN